MCGMKKKYRTVWNVLETFQVAWSHVFVSLLVRIINFSTIWLQGSHHQQFDVNLHSHPLSSLAHSWIIQECSIVERDIGILNLIPRSYWPIPLRTWWCLRGCWGFWKHVSVSDPISLPEILTAITMIESTPSNNCWLSAEWTFWFQEDAKIG